MSPTILRGVAWQAGTTVMARGARWITLLILGGLLVPEEFGRFAALYVIIDGLTLLQGLGLGPAFVVRREAVQESAESTFLLSAVAGALFTAVAWGLAPALAGFYHDATLVEAFRVLSCVLFVQSLRVVPLRWAERDLAFERKVLPTLAGVVTHFVVAVTLAWRGHGVWSLIWAVVASGSVETLAYWLSSRWRPRFRLSWRIVREDLRFGVPVATGALLAFAFQALDRVFLGRVAGAGGLGPYAFSHSLTTMPLASGVVSLNTVLLPSYGRRADDASRLDLFQRSLRVLAGFGLLFVLGVVCFGPAGLRAVYGAKWLAAEPVLRWLVVGALFRAFTGLVGEYLVGAGRPGAFRTVNAVQLALAALAIVPAYRAEGVVGVAAAMAGATALAFLVGMVLVARRASAGGGALVAPLMAPLVAATVTFGLAWTARSFVPSTIPALAGACLLTTVVYLGAWWMSDPTLRDIVRGRFSR